MRKSMLLFSVVCLAATVAFGQGKISSGWNCAKPSTAQNIDVGDQPGHAYGVNQFKCTATKGEIAGVKEKEGTGTESAEMTSKGSSAHGMFIETLANGDKIHISYQSTGTMKDGKMTGSNKWKIEEGTGKFKGIKGSGSCTGTANADMSSTYTCTGTYTGVK
jgi:hypothetical protein